MAANAQLPLFPPAPPPELMRRLPPGPGRDPVFFAVLVGAVLDREIEALIEPERQRRKLSSPLLGSSTRHVSVAGVGYHQQLAIEDLGVAWAAADGVAFAPFDIALSHLMTFKPRPRGAPLVLVPDDSAPLAELERQLRWGMLERGFEPRSMPVTRFHMTLLYDQVQVPSTRLAKPLILRIDGFAPVRSHFGQGRYDVLGTWPTG